MLDDRLQAWLDQDRAVVAAVMHPNWGLTLVASPNTLAQLTDQARAVALHDSDSVRALWALAGAVKLRRMLDD